jgi:hypothetical protein
MGSLSASSNRAEQPAADHVCDECQRHQEHDAAGENHHSGTEFGYVHEQLCHSFLDLRSPTGRPSSKRSIMAEYFRPVS